MNRRMLAFCGILFFCDGHRIKYQAKHQVTESGVPLRLTDTFIYLSIRMEKQQYTRTVLFVNKRRKFSMKLKQQVIRVLVNSRL